MKTFSRFALTSCLAMAAAFACSAKASASSFETVYSFPKNPIPGYPPNGPAGPMVAVNAFIYGTIYQNCSVRTIFKYDPALHAASTIYTFGDNNVCSSSGLATDGRGAIYGDSPAELFSVAPATDALTILFQARRNIFPSPPTIDGSGNLYGVKVNGFEYGGIAKYHAATGAKTLVYQFPTPGYLLYQFVVNQAGTTLYGSSGKVHPRRFYGPGQIIKIDLATQALSVLHVFSTGYDGEPTGPLVINGAGILFGVTQYGGKSGAGCRFGCGRIFKLDPNTGRETTLYSFQGGNDGGFPTAGISLGPDGKIYGTTEVYGGAAATLFQFDVATRVHTVLHVFTEAEGYQFNGPPTLASDGSIYVADANVPAPTLAGYLFRYTPDAPSPLPPRHGAPVLPTSVKSDAGR